ncbi:hypothetical protein [Methylocystis bryophila]|uniref:hypothetical protein n=1 Tax=Methylocystis bryophila TaxID=655015 RepID=UPI001319C377|nr:hypothetical protein [Methylocystis bryophila]
MTKLAEMQGVCAAPRVPALGGDIAKDVVTAWVIATSTAALIAGVFSVLAGGVA